MNPGFSQYAVQQGMDEAPDRKRGMEEALKEFVEKGAEVYARGESVWAARQHRPTAVW